MRVRDEVSAEKLRGGFYTPPSLVQACLARVSELTASVSTPLRILEPSAGDGAFIRGLSTVRHEVGSVTAVELLDDEAAKARSAISESALLGRVIEGDFVQWALSATERYDAAVGNPPFVRFQFVSDDVRQATDRLGEELGITFRGVSNLWLPVFLGAMSLLRPGGAFSFVVPAESFTGISAGVVRAWLATYVDSLRADLFPAGSFPGVLQEVIVLSGTRRAAAAQRASLHIYEHTRYNGALEWSHLLEPSQEPWTRFLLRPRLLESLRQASDLETTVLMGEIARFEVAAVTGANDFFSVDQATIKKYQLADWVLPLLPRIRHAPGLSYTARDHIAATETGARTGLLDFSASNADPREFTAVMAYLRLGEERALHSRYKTRIRDPWYRVPHIRPAPLLLSKRSHWYPRLVLNEKGAVTTDTIYRGTVRPGAPTTAAALVASFHNSLTLLSAEVEGRNFGGGVLELVPSEVARLRVPLMASAEEMFGTLDAASRIASDPEELIRSTDTLLLSMPGMTADLLEDLRQARKLLQGRRLDRASYSPGLVPVHHGQDPRAETSHSPQPQAVTG